MTPEGKLEKISTLIVDYGGIDGDQHKAWVLDQIFREIHGTQYSEQVALVRDGEDGPETYSWDEGIAP